MTLLILGLILFLGMHSIRIVADDWRTARVAQFGENGWKGLYSLASALGLALVVWGYGLARAEPVVLWAPPGWTKHVAALLTRDRRFVFVQARPINVLYTEGQRWRYD